MNLKDKKPDFASIEGKPIPGLYFNKEQTGKIKYDYSYQGEKRITASNKLLTALQKFFPINSNAGNS